MSADRIKAKPSVRINCTRTAIGNHNSSSGEIGGPSAGLMWALGLYDLLTTGDLTDGRTIAGTGQIALDGTVIPIAGIEGKLSVAADAGASVFLVPQGNMKAARASGAGGWMSWDAAPQAGATQAQAASRIPTRNVAARGSAGRNMGVDTSRQETFSTCPRVRACDR